jgi:branched-subunit amino acid aminotransferase/4-amino-4-deoxychorismate lyase
LVERNQVKSGMARIYVTGGLNRWGVKRQAPGEPTLVATTQELPARPGDPRAVISSIRLDAASKLAGIKSANRLLYVLAQDEAELKGFADAVLLNGAGHVVELTTSNVFVVKNDALFTPPLSDGPLPGITRAAVLTIAAELGIAAHETSFGAEIFSQADNVFATNSLIEIEPIWEVDGTKFREHHVTKRLQNAYRDLVREELGL